MRLRGASLAVFLSALLSSAPRAVAWPVDVAVSLPLAEPTFRKLKAIEWVEVDSPDILEAEVLESGELLLTGKRLGRSLLLLYAEGKFAVWQVTVSQAPAPVQVDGQLLASAKAACEGFNTTSGVDRTLVARVTNERCRAALLALLRTEAFTAGSVELTFDGDTLQRQLAELTRALSAQTLPAAARYVGAGLVLSGELTAAQHRSALWTVFRHSVGRVALDDQVVLVKENR